MLLCGTTPMGFPASGGGRGAGGGGGYGWCFLCQGSEVGKNKQEVNMVFQPMKKAEGGRESGATNRVDAQIRESVVPVVRWLKQCSSKHT